jgi:hypothetical protein
VRHCGAIGFAEVGGRSGRVKAEHAKGDRVERSERGEPGEFERMSDEELREAVAESARALGFVPSEETQH